jgi:tRNA modification GTPase
MDQSSRVWGLQEEELYISARSHQGLKKLETLIVERCCKASPFGKDEVVLTNERHKKAIEEVITCLQKALDAIKKDLSFEFISEDLRRGIQSLQFILGEGNLEEDVLTEIFSQFCVGK